MKVLKEIGATVGLLAILVFAVMPKMVLGFGLSLPFGGRIISTTVPGITCTGTGIISIFPSGIIPPPYVISLGSQGKGTVTSGSWILGWYNPIFNLGNCETGSGVPTPSVNISSYHTSGSGLF